MAAIGYRFREEAKELGPAVGLAGYFEPGSLSYNLKQDPEFTVTEQDVTFVKDAAHAVLSNKNGFGFLFNMITGRRRAAKGILRIL